MEYNRRSCWNWTYTINIYEAEKNLALKQAYLQLSEATSQTKNSKETYLQTVSFKNKQQQKPKNQQYEFSRVSTL